MGSIDLPASATPDVTVIVVLTVDAARAEKCLRSIALAAPPVATEVVLVLNGAAADVRALVDERVRGARVVDAAIDLGFVQAFREGLGLARAQRVASLHEDSFPHERWLAPLVETLDDRPHAAIVAARQLRPDGRHLNEGWVHWRDGHASVITGELAQPDGSPPRPVDGASSAGLLADRAFLVALDLPDERWFPAGYTDVDMSRSTWVAGRVVLHDPRSVVVHGRQAMVQRNGPPNRGRHLPSFLYARNREKFLAKWGQELAGQPERSEGTWPDRVPPREMRAALTLTAERAARVEAGPPPAPLPDPPVGPDADHETVDEATIERGRNRRAELDSEFTAWLSEQLDARSDEIEALRAHIDAVERETKRAVDSNADLTEELRRVHAAYAELRAEYDARA